METKFSTAHQIEKSRIEQVDKKLANLEDSRMKNHHLNFIPEIIHHPC